jgi:hypothetical protein
MVAQRVELLKITDSDLLALWRKHKGQVDSTVWDKLVRGLLDPKSNAERELIHLREELRKRNLFDSKHLH